MRCTKPRQPALNELQLAVLLTSLPLGRGSRVTGRGSRVNGQGSTVTSRGWKNSAQLLGSYALHTDLIVRGNLVSVSVCQCVTLRTRRHVTLKLLAGRLGTSDSKLFRRPLLLPSCCCGCVLNCSRFLCVGKILKNFPLQISSICSR